MASSACSALLCSPVVNQRSPYFTSRRPAQAPRGLGSFKQTLGNNSLLTSAPQRSACSQRSRTAVHASAVEVFQLADEAALIGGTAAVLFACTLVGLAVGFVLLRVEALVEEGKI